MQPRQGNETDESRGGICRIAQSPRTLSQVMSVIAHTGQTRCGPARRVIYVGLACVVRDAADGVKDPGQTITDCDVR